MKKQKVTVHSADIEADDDLGQAPVDEMKNETSKSASVRKLEAFGFTVETLMESQSQPPAS